MRNPSLDLDAIDFDSSTNNLMQEATDILEPYTKDWADPDGQIIWIADHHDWDRADAAANILTLSYLRDEFLSDALWEEPMPTYAEYVARLIMEITRRWLAWS